MLDHNEIQCLLSSCIYQSEKRCVLSTTFTDNEESQLPIRTSDHKMLRVASRLFVAIAVGPLSNLMRLVNSPQRHVLAGPVR